MDLLAGLFKVRKDKSVRTIDAKEVGLGKPAEETYNRPNSSSVTSVFRWRKSKFSKLFTVHVRKEAPETLCDLPPLRFPRAFGAWDQLPSWLIYGYLATLQSLTPQT